MKRTVTHRWKVSYWLVLISWILGSILAAALIIDLIHKWGEIMFVTSLVDNHIITRSMKVLNSGIVVPKWILAQWPRSWINYIPLNFELLYTFCTKEVTQWIAIIVGLWAGITFHVWGYLIANIPWHMRGHRAHLHRSRHHRSTEAHRPEVTRTERTGADGGKQLGRG